VTKRVHLFPHAAALLLAWGAFAFGAEFTWAYAPLLVFSIAVSALGFLAGARQPESTWKTYRSLILALALLFTAAIVQVIPLPATVVSVVSPARDDTDYAKLYARFSLQEIDESAPPEPARTLSIERSRSLLGLAFLFAFSVLLVGSARGFSGVRPTALARYIIILGVIGAFAEIIQKSSGSLDIYGVFTPRQPGSGSAPLINRNHMAGWLIMAMSVSLGYLASCLSRGMRNLRPDWRSRAVWLSSSDAAEAALAAFAVVVIAIAVISTESRSGSVCLVLISLLFGWWVTTRQSSASKKALTWLHVGFVLATAAIMGGADAVARRFATMDVNEPDSRISVWRDGGAMVKDFPMTGTGLNTYGVAALRYQEVKEPYLYIEAHNDYLQVAAEGGLLLGIPALVLLFALIAQIRKRFAADEDDSRVYWLRAGAVIAFCAMAFQSMVDFTLQMPGAAVLFVVLAGLAVHRPARRVSS
jgi:putative inorganic carbon (HCO3(-)) transporter